MPTDDDYESFDGIPEPMSKKMKGDSETIASIAGGTNGLGSSLIICKFSRLMHYIDDLKEVPP
jgi:hypothetical protein